MAKKEKIKLEKEKRDYMISELRSYFYNERDEELTELAASMLLDFIIDKLAPEFFNKGVYDSYTYMTDRIEDLLSIQKY